MLHTAHCMLHVLFEGTINTLTLNPKTEHASQHIGVRVESSTSHWSNSYTSAQVPVVLSQHTIALNDGTCNGIRRVLSLETSSAIPYKEIGVTLVTAAVMQLVCVMRRKDNENGVLSLTPPACQFTYRICKHSHSHTLTTLARHTHTAATASQSRFWSLRER